MKNKILITILVVGLVAVGLAYFMSKKTDRSDKSDLIKVFHPAANSLITSPLTVEGEARGYWFFEASFPVKLVDEAGNLIVQHYAQAQGEWMTENFIPFKSELVFNTDAERGFLVLEKDNPSGLPENADELRIPVRFETGKTTVKAFFNNSELDPEFSCDKVFPVERRIMKTSAVGRAALEELLKGPTEREKEQGFLTSLPLEGGENPETDN